MELDTGQVRAFVAVAEQSHFGRAAEQLFISQQGLSKRIQRLEHALGHALLRRGPRGAELTAAGRTFLPHARALLASADAGQAALQLASPPARIDVWGAVQAPLRVVREFNDFHSDVVLELSMRRGLASALGALTRDELDAVFGRPHDLDDPWPDGVSRRLVCFEPLSCLVVDGHPLADSELLRPEDLIDWGVWWPLDGSPVELVGFFRSFAEEYGVPTDRSGPNLGLEALLHELHARPELVSLAGSQWAMPADAGVRRIPLEPAPSYPWYIVWNAVDTHPDVQRLLGFLAESFPIESIDTNPTRVWIPRADREALDHSADGPAAKA